MIFEVGKFYEHATQPTMLAIRGKLSTTIWGECLVAESNADMIGLIPITERQALDWNEISEERWLSSFSTQGDGYAG